MTVLEQLWEEEQRLWKLAYAAHNHVMQAEERCYDRTSPEWWLEHDERWAVRRSLLLTSNNTWERACAATERRVELERTQEP